MFNSANKGVGGKINDIFQTTLTTTKTQVAEARVSTTEGKFYNQILC